MLQKLFFFILGGCLAVQVSGQTMQEQLKYVERYKALAVWEMERMGVPASIKLAQAILESRWGTTDLAVIANNHFGIKCGGSVWSGAYYYKVDDDYDAQGRLIESCFRQYSSAEESYIAHSEFLRDPFKKDRYGFLFSLDPTDYRAWANGLKKAGYATDPNYHTKLIRIIEQLNLTKYDRVPLENVLPADREFVWRYRRDATPLAPLPVVVQSNLQKASAIRASSPPVTSYWTYDPDRDRPALLLEKHKRRQAAHSKDAYKGQELWHTVRPNELMVHIAEQYRLYLPALYRRNQIPEGSEIAAGQRVKIKGGKVDQAPMLRPAVAAVSDLAAVSDSLRAEASIADPFTKPLRGGPSASGSSMYGGSIVPPAGANPSLGAVQAGRVEPLPLPSSPVPAARQTSSSKPTESAPQQVRYHVVKSGDTLSSIARQHSVSVEELKTMNALQNNIIVIGTALRVR